MSVEEIRRLDARVESDSVKINAMDQKLASQKQLTDSCLSDNQKLTDALVEQHKVNTTLQQKLKSMGGWNTLLLGTALAETVLLILLR